jgi:clan AA aspartic protease (TIGR02281 family)
MLRGLLLSAVAVAAVSPAFAAQYHINRCASIQGNDTWMLAFDQQNNKVNFWREDEDHGVHFGFYTVETNGDTTMEVGNNPAVHITMHPSGFTAWRSGNYKGTMNCVTADDTDFQPVRWYDPSQPVTAPEPAPTFADAPAPVPAVTTIVPAPPSSTIDKVPITFGKGGAYVAVSIGTMPATMLVDTGATGMTVSETIADWLVANGQATNGSIDHVTLAGGVQKDFRSVDIDSVAVGGHVVRNVHAGVVPDGADMLLGLGVLAQVSPKFTVNVATSTLDFN